MVSFLELLLSDRAASRPQNEVSIESYQRIGLSEYQ